MSTDLRRAGVLTVATAVMVGYLFLSVTMDRDYVETLTEPPPTVEQVLTAKIDSLMEACAARETVSEIIFYSDEYDIGYSTAEMVYNASFDAGIPAKLAFALVQAESNFRPRVVSSADAYGMAQVQLPTANDVRPGTTREDLLNPELNLRIGFVYLRQLITQFGDTAVALSAYNGGPSRARSGWRNRAYETKILK